ncbi:GNAT family N-acetyltransferase [Pendulispora albinea]|uniref:GNAT family N-acetyltransferase n=1 Tax=Pendulispora albinea TaxID=2741071 RepID=A0ABZ2LTW0_9BACT
MVDPAALQRIASRGWPAVETEPLGPWLLRAAGGFTRRANSALATEPPDRPLDEALAHVTQWYLARGLPAYVQLVQGTALDAELERRGWLPEAPVHVQIAKLDALRRALGEGHDHDETPGALGEDPHRDESPRSESPRDESPRDDVAISDLPDAPWIARYHKACNLHANALHVLRGGPHVAFATLRGGDPARARAIGRCVIVDGWAGFSAIEVDPAHRRRGLATTVMRALTRWAARAGATDAYLQVETDNAPAIALYARLGFVTHHDYHYRRAPARHERRRPITSS